MIVDYEEEKSQALKMIGITESYIKFHVNSPNFFRKIKDITIYYEICF